MGGVRLPRSCQRFIEVTGGEVLACAHCSWEHGPDAGPVGVELVAALIEQSISLGVLARSHEQRCDDQSRVYLKAPRWASIPGLDRRSEQAHRLGEPAVIPGN